MNGIDVKCPICGKVNKSLFLEETGGKYECEKCEYCGKVKGYDSRILVIRIKKIKKGYEETGTNGERLTPLTV